MAAVRSNPQQANPGMTIMAKSLIDDRTGLAKKMFSDLPNL